jgi:hypothetical protein
MNSSGPAGAPTAGRAGKEGEESERHGYAKEKRESNEMWIVRKPGIRS